MPTPIPKHRSTFARSSHSGRSTTALTGCGIALAMVVTAVAAPIAPPAAAQPAAAQTPASASWLPPQLDSWSTITQRTATDPVPVTNGVTFASESIASIDGNVPINVVTADTKNSNVRIGAVVAHDSVIDPADETTTSMANRTGAVAGINGGYFKINASGQANDGEIVDGEIWKSPTGNHEGTVSVLDDGSVVYGKQDFSGTLAVTGGASRALTSINTLDDATGDGITAITPRLGEVASTWFGGTHVLAIGTSTDGGRTITVTSVGTAESISGKTYGLVAGPSTSAGGQWVQQNVKVGSVISTTATISPNNNIKQMIQGPGRILAGGKVFDDPVNQMPTGLHPESAIGSTADGRLIMATFDGQKTADVALGVGWQQVADYLKEQGAVDAVLLDGGGSTALTVRRPGATTNTVANVPSDLTERPVGNGLFVYSTAEKAGPATKAWVNGGRPLSTAIGVASKLPAYATDAAGNPADDQVEVRVVPEKLGSYRDGVFTAGAAGSGELQVRAGNAVATVPLTVAGSFDSLTISPAQVGLANGASTRFTVQGSNGEADPVTVEPGSATWAVDDSALGSINATTGTFTAAATGNGQAAVTATVAGGTATAAVSVGAVIQPLVTADSAAEWKMSAEGNITTVPTDRFAETTDVPPGSGQEKALQVQYSFPNNTAQHRVRATPGGGAGIKIYANELGQLPQYTRFTFRVDSAAPQKSWIVLDVKDSAGHVMGLWIELAASDYNHWVEKTAKLNWGVFTTYPLIMQDISFVGQNATAASVGTFTLASMRVQYAVGSPTQQDTYRAIDPKNPSWLRYTQDPAAFKPGGKTFIIGDDGHLVAANPTSTSATNIDNMTKRITGQSYTSAAGQTVAPLPAVARPDVAVSLGDIGDTGQLADLQFAKSQWEKFGVPLYDVVGNHETSQSTIPQNTNFFSVFGQDTHFAFQQGNATFIGLDNSNGSINGSDARQQPAQAQYPWFVDQLSAADTPVVFVGVHMPAYDPAPNKSNQFASRWEAQQFLQIIDDYRRAHPQQRVVVMYGHSRGFADQLLDPKGNNADAVSGIPQFTIADIGMPPYMAADQGGFHHFALFHVNKDGTVQYSVQPLLQSVTIDQGTPGADAAAPRTDSLPLGGSRTYTATAVNTKGSDLGTPPTMRVADPMSHVWASSNPAVARVDPTTGAVIAHKVGTTTISVTTGGITAAVTVTVKKGR